MNVLVDTCVWSKTLRQKSLDPEITDKIALSRLGCAEEQSPTFFSGLRMVNVGVRLAQPNLHDC